MRRLALKALLSAGFSQADMEAGRVGIEDGFLLLEDLEATERKKDDAQHRLERHFELESKRREAGLETDFERWQRGGPVRD